MLHHDLNTYSKNNESGFGKQFEDSTENGDGCHVWYSHPLFCNQRIQRKDAAFSRAPLLDLEVWLNASGGTRWMRSNFNQGQEGPETTHIQSLMSAAHLQVTFSKTPNLNNMYLNDMLLNHMLLNDMLLNNMYLNHMYLNNMFLNHMLLNNMYLNDMYLILNDMFLNNMFLNMYLNNILLNNMYLNDMLIYNMYLNNMYLILNDMSLLLNNMYQLLNNMNLSPTYVTSEQSIC